MNRDKFEGSWKELKGKIKEKWGKLTDDDIMQINGKYERFLGVLQKRYGYEKERAEKEFTGWNYGGERDSKNCHECAKPDLKERDLKGHDRDDNHRRKAG